MNDVLEQTQTLPTVETYTLGLDLTEGDKSVRVGIEEIRGMDAQMKEQVPEVYTKLTEKVKDQFPEGAIFTTPLKRYIPTDTMYVEKGLSIFATKLTKDETGKDSLFSVMLNDRDFEQMGLTQEEIQKLKDMANQSKYIDKQE